MEIQSLSCNNCGASLDVAAHANYVTCAYCGSRLAVHRTSNSAYTEILDAIDKRTSKILSHTDELLQQNKQLTSHLEQIRIQNEIDKLDQSWERTQEEWAASFYRGTKPIPVQSAINMRVRLWMILLGIVSLIAIYGILASAYANYATCLVVFLPIIALAIWQIVVARQDAAYARDFDAAYTQYLGEREDLEMQMHELENQVNTSPTIQVRRARITPTKE